MEYKAYACDKVAHSFFFPIDWHHHNQPATPTDDMYSSSSTQVGETMPPISSVIYGGEAMKPESKDTPRLKLQPVKPDGA